MSAENGSNFVIKSLIGPACVDKNIDLGKPDVENTWEMPEREQSISVALICDQSDTEHDLDSLSMIYGLRYQIGIVNIAERIAQLPKSEALQLLSTAIQQKTSYPDKENPAKFIPMLGTNTVEWGFMHDRANLSSIVISRDFYYDQPHQWENQQVFFDKWGNVQYFDYTGGNIADLVENTPGSVVDKNHRDLVDSLVLIGKNIWYREAWERAYGDVVCPIRFTPFRMLYDRAAAHRRQIRNGTVSSLFAEDYKLLTRYSDIRVDKTKSGKLFGDLIPAVIPDNILSHKKTSDINEILMHSASKTFIEEMVRNEIPFVGSHTVEVDPADSSTSNIVRNIICFGPENFADIPRRINTVMTSPMRQIEDLLTQFNYWYFMATKEKNGSGEVLFCKEDLERLTSDEVDEGIKNEIISKAFDTIAEKAIIEPTNETTQ